MFLASNQALPVINLYIDEIFSSYVYAMQGKDDTSCFDDYSKLGPMKHEFVLTAEDQLIFKDLWACSKVICLDCSECMQQP